VKRYLRACGENCLITDFEKLPISNKEVWKVKGDGKIKSSENTLIIGEFTLYKKQNP